MTIRTIHDGLTLENLNASIDAIIRDWDAVDWRAFCSRYVDLQFNQKDRPRPRASIPAQADDDDLVLWRVIEHARARLSPNPEAP